MEHFWQRKLTMLCFLLAAILLSLSLQANKLHVVDGRAQITQLEQEVEQLAKDRQRSQIALDLSTQELAREKIIRDVKYQQKDNEVALEMRGFSVETVTESVAAPAPLSNWQKWHQLFVL
jgi:hypothetical protein